jgi:phosphopantothenoylcysteine synthetase/decarboxylase
MTDKPSLIGGVAQAFRDHGLTAALTALIGGPLALAAAVTRKAFTNEALLERLDRELGLERDHVEHQRAEDRKADADRLDRIETDIRAMHDMLFDAFQRGRSD